MIESEAPIVLLANTAILGPGQVLEQPRVQSRMLLWCRGGAGTVTVHGVAFALEHGCVVCMPWLHDVRYEAAAREPLQLAGVHLVPQLAGGRAVAFGIVHGAESSLADEAPHRHDHAMPGLERPVSGRWRPESPLRHLAEYTVQWFRRGDLDEAEARRIGDLHFREWPRFMAGGDAAARDVPPRLERVFNYVERNLQRGLALDALAGVAGCSRATLTRLFRRHAGASPSAWVTRQRMDRAAELLVQTSLTVAEVGARVGIEDPSYFSKLFRRIQGETCTARRRRGALYGL